MLRTNVRSSVEDIYPLTPLQQGMLVHTLQDPLSYFQQFALTLEGEVESDLLRDAWQAALDRHPALRTSFLWQRRKAPLQVVHRRLDLPFAFHDLTAIPPEAREDAYRTRCAEDRACPFTLEKPPLLRLALFKLAETRYRLLFSHHHLLCDGWSLGTLLRDVVGCYRARLTGASWAPPPIRPFRDYLAWLQRQDSEEALAFWREQLAGLNETALPEGFPTGGAVSPFEEARHTLPAEVAIGVRAAARAWRVTPSAVLQGLWALVLGLRTAAPEVCFGATVSGRGAPLPGLSDMVGVFINTLPMRARLDPSLPLEQAFADLHARLAHAQEYDYVALPEMRRAAGLPPGMALFQSLVVVENHPLGSVAAELDGLPFRASAHAGFECTGYPLTLSIVPDGERYHLECAYQTARFGAESVARLLVQYEEIAREAGAAPSMRIGDLRGLPPAEREALASWNAPVVAEPGMLPLQQLFDRYAAERPESTAVVAGDREMTYAATRDLSHRIAHLLAARGIGPEQRVGVCVEKTAELPALLLGILKAGACAVMLDPAQATRRTALMAAGARLSLLVTSTPRPELSGDALLLSDLLRRSNGYPTAVPGVAIPPESLAYVVFTSGSTGEPKGVGVSHRALALTALAWKRAYGLTPGMRHLQMANVAFDVFWGDFARALGTGGCLVLCPRETLLSPPELLTLLREQRIQCAEFVPAVARGLMEHARAVGAVLDGFHLVAVGSDIWRVHEHRALRALLPPSARLVDSYGLTEATIDSCFYEGDLEGNPPEACTPIGRRLPHARLYVLDGRLRQVPPGVPGELYIGGWALARGYLDRPGLTAEAFVPDPLASEPGARMYRTGDFARYRPDGTLELLGRVDSQVKIRGVRIETGEIEACLRKCPGVRDAVVDARAWNGGEKRLAAYCVAGDQPPDARRLRVALKEMLPAAMVPLAFVFVPAIPLNANGKVDRAALPDPEPLPDAGDYVPPRTPEEEIVAGVWQDVLGVERVGATDDFFELGGHSLLATQVIARLRSALGGEIPLRLLFETTTLAEFVAAATGGRTTAAAPLTTPGPRGEDLPLSFAQERMWFLQRLAPATAAMNQPDLLRLRGDLDPTALERALHALADRHEVLRTTYPSQDGVPRQRIAARACIPFTEQDFRALPAPEREAAARRMIQDEARRPFDLENGPLVRCVLARLGDEEWLLLVVMHHILSDGWSGGVVVREVAALYEAEITGRPAVLPALPVQYADYARWEREEIARVREEGLAYWLEHLREAPALDLLTDFPRAAGGDDRAAAVTAALHATTVQDLRRLAREEGATLFMALFSAFAVLLRRYGGQEDVVIGTPVANRRHRETEDLIGLFVNTLALRCDLTGEPTFRELLARVRRTALAGYSHQDVPFDLVVDALHPSRDLTRNPVYQALFVLQNTPSEPPALPGVTVRVEPLPPPATRLDLTMAVDGEGDDLTVTLVYPAGLFREETARRMLEHYQRLLKEAIAGAETPVTRLSLLTPGDREALAAWQGQARTLEGDPLLHRAIHRRALTDPEREAVRAGEQTLTYGELDTLARCLAARLRRAGVGPDAVVGLLLPRSPELVIGALAALHAGGAFLPLDPHTPEERLAFILRETQVKVLLTPGTAPALSIPAGITRLALDGGSLAALPPEEYSEERLSPESLAYVIYTSGSTGVPKGVALAHAAAANMAQDLCRQYAITAEDRLLQAVSPTFDVACGDLLMALLAGATLVLAPPLEGLSGEQLADLIERRRITFTQVTPTVMATLPERPLPTLRAISVGGESCPMVLARRWATPTRAVFHSYGPTETTVCAATHRVRPGKAGDVPPLGGPIANVTAYVLDEYLQLCPAGVPGELYLGGAGVARGYIARPDLTAAAFVPDPFGGRPGARLYRTGDIVCWNDDGTLRFLGRRDGQVKLRGHRIELPEIEAALRRVPGVRDALALVREDRPGARRLVAYLVGAVDADAPRRELARILPDYMIPSAFVSLEAFPRTRTGKLERAALPTPPDAVAESVAPRNEMEARLAEIWRQVLPDAGSFGVHDDFFALGGHSMLAVRVMAQAGKLLGVDAPLRALFDHPTLAGLAQFLEGRRQQGITRRGPRPGLAPGPALSSAQARLWFVEQLAPGTALYHLPLLLRLRGHLDLEALRAALAAVVARHEPLRLAITAADGVPYPSLLEGLAPELPVTGVPSPPDGDAPAELLRLAAAEAERPFSLERGPLCRFHLYRLAADDHALLLVLHHIAADGWSLGVMSREIAAVYAAAVRGEEACLPPPEIRYSDYAVWQQQAPAESMDASLEYWRERLEGAPDLSVPTDRPRPAIRGGRGGLERVQFPPEFAARLNAFAAGHGVTLYMLLLAGWSALLSQYSGQDDFVIGSPVAGRDAAETAGLVGLFVNSLPMRLDLSGDPSFLDLLGRARPTVLYAFSHQELPFERLVEELRPGRNLAQNPVFQVMFTLENQLVEEVSLPGLTLLPLELPTTTAKFDLTLSVAASGGGLTGAIEYDADLFHADTIRRMLAHLTQLLQQALERPETPCAALPLLDRTGEEQILRDWSRCATPYPQTRTVVDLFAETARRFPAQVAATCGDESLTYAELDRRSNRLARHLQALGARPDALIGVAIPRSLEEIIALVGILKAGGAYLPLDAAFPPDRLRFLLEDSGAHLVVVAGDLPEALQGIGQRVVSLTHDAGRIAAAGETLPAVPLTPAHAAYVNYTSGSTGIPKGVLIPHGAIVRLVKETNYFAFAPRQVIAHHATLSFDAATYEIWGPLLNGGAVRVIPQRQVLDALANPQKPSPFAGVDGTFLTTMLFNQIVAERPDLLAETGCVLSGGEAASVRHVRLAHERLPRLRLCNVYGPTETTTFASWHLVEKIASDAFTVPIGRPIANTELYVLSPALRPLPPGVPGELYIGGPGLARGYLGRPDLTAERFVPHPFSERPGERLYRTGDLVRRTPEGAIEYLGRMDQQVKVRGFRIEPGELEHVARTLPGVRAAAVAVQTDAIGARQLVAYVVAEPALTEAMVRERLRERLPEYLLPAALLFVPEIPLNKNGKADLGALPRPEFAAHPKEFTPPATAEERLVAGIWAETLGVARVAADDGFFALGGHSLLATRAVARVRQATGLDVPLRLLFEAPTVAVFAERLARLRPNPDARTIPAVPREGPLALSYAQERLWFLEQFTPGTALYNVPLALRLRGPLDAAALQAALRDLVARHEVLRAAFPTSAQGTPVAVIRAEADLPLLVITVAGQDLEAREAELVRLLEAEAHTPFDLALGPLVRARLFRLGEEDAVLTLTLHHTLCDGWSIGILEKELLEQYLAHAGGCPAPAAPSGIQYADYAAWQRSPAVQRQWDESLGYWARHLADPPTLELPTDRPRPAMTRHAGSEVTFRLPAAVVARVEELARELDATPYMVLLAGFTALLARYSGQDDLVVGTPVANREAPEVQEMIGLFVNTLALRVAAGGECRFRDLVARVRETALAAYEHQQVPFERVVDAVQPGRDTSRNPIFQVMFVLQNLVRPEMAVAASGLDVAAVRVPSRVAKFDLTVTLDPEADGIAGIAEFRTDLFDTATIARMMRHYERLLAAGVGAPDTALAELPLLDDEERAGLLAFSQPEHRCVRRIRPRACHSEALLHDLVGAVARRRSDAVALTFDGRHLTYGELDARANALAWELACRGAGPDTGVGVFLDRGFDLVVSLLAILKAGAAYVPIDPRVPAERARYILEDSRASLVLTDAALRERLPAGLDATVITVDELERRHAPDPPPCAARPDHLAYVIYTSGSTGRPKGNGITHRNAVRLFTGTDHWFHFSESDVWTLFHSSAFDFSVWEIWGALLYGGRLAIVPYEVSRTPEQFYDLLAREGVTVLNQTPSAFRALIQEESARVDRGEALPRLALRAVIFGGEALDPGALLPWYRRHPEDAPRLVNMYGITETTVHVTYRPLSREEAAAHAGSNIGIPLPDLSLYVLDEHLQPVPVGVRGEIFVAGGGLARGYLGRPDLTAERFLPDPFGSKPGARMYRSGDCGRYRADGTLEYLGRNDDQVKIRGFRIELGEVEAALRAAPAVTDAVVLPREDIPGQKRLVGYVVGTEDWGAVRAYLSRHLPDYMIPAAFVSLPAIPLTANGKVDRKALPAPAATREESRPYQAPRTPEEATLAGIWAEVLGIERVGAEDNFFELGGDSILSIQVVSRARVAGLFLSPRDLFRAQTVAELARCASRTGVDATQSEEPDGPFPLTPIQRWFWDAQPEERRHFNQAVLLRLGRPVDPETVRAALNALLAHHAALRLRFDERGQRFAPSAEWPMAVQPSPASPEEYAAACTEAQRALDPVAGPLARAVYFTPPEGEQARLFLVIHHLAVDGVSWRILLEDLRELLLQSFRGERPLLPPPTTGYARWARLAVEDAGSAATRAEAPYWQRQYHPLAIPSGNGDHRHGQPIGFALSTEETGHLLREAHGAYHTQINDLLLAALAAAVRRWNGSGQVSVMLEGHGREERPGVDLSRTVGWFTALYPVLLACPEGDDAGALIRSVKEQLRRVPRSGIGYGLLRYLGRGPESEALRAQPEPALCFNYLGQFDAGAPGDGILLPAGEPVGESISPRRRSPFAIEITGSVQNRALAVTFARDAGRAGHMAVSGLAALYLEEIRRLIQHCLRTEDGGHTPSDFALAANLSQQNLDSLLRKFGGKKKG